MILAEISRKEGLVTRYEFTAPGTPQQNGIVERAFATLFGRVRAMMNHALFSTQKRGELWAECAATATKLENMLSDKGDEPSPYMKFYKKNPEYARELRTFGEIGVVTDHTKRKIAGKLEDRGRTCMFVGYAHNHAGDVYRMFTLDTQKVIMSRDIIWLNKVYGQYKGLKPGTTQIIDTDIEIEYQPVLTQTSDPIVLEEQESEPVITPVPEEVTSEQKEKSKKHDRLRGELRRLNTSYNPQEISDMAFISATTSSYTEPQTFKEAWNHAETDEREGWQGAIEKELNDMITKNVWTEMSITAVPKDRK
jgi:hypothetical protein